jgi:hypothetical protein
MKPKRYIVFQYEDYYPSGGWGDLQGSFDTLEEARAFAQENRHDNTDIIDLETGEDVCALGLGQG